MDTTDNLIKWDPQEVEQQQAYAVAADGAQWAPVEGARTNEPRREE